VYKLYLDEGNANIYLEHTTLIHPRPSPKWLSAQTKRNEAELAVRSEYGSLQSTLYLEGFVVVHTFLSAIVHRVSIGYQQLAAYTLVGKQCNQQNILPVWTFITLSTGLLRKMPQRKALTSHIAH
jgi:hypothetical protein